jgi:hypothetical protein
VNLAQDAQLGANTILFIPFPNIPAAHHPHDG